MKKVLILSLILFTTSAYLQASAKCKKTGLEIMKKQKKKQHVDYEVMTQKVVLEDLKTNIKETRKLRRHSMDKGAGKTKTLTSFLSPNDIKGTALLNWKNEERSDDQWLFLPALNKMQRIAPSGKRKYFMGTDFTYSDLEGETLANWNYRCLGTEACGRKKCYKIEAIPKNSNLIKETGYSKRTLWVRKKIYTTTKADFYNRKGKLLKTMENSKFKKYKKKLWRAKKSVMTRVGFHKTTMLIKEITLNDKIDSKTFTERFITKSMHTR
jgi:outer membrane lipoprotein-sorting protein